MEGDATRQIKPDPSLMSTPVIAISSFAMKGDEDKAHASGCDAYVTKRGHRLARSVFGDVVLAR